MSLLVEHCQSHGYLHRLQSFTTTAPEEYDSLAEWMDCINRLLSQSPIEFLQLGMASANINATIPDEFWTTLVNRHGPRVSLSTITIWNEVVRLICEGCQKLEQFFFSTRERHGELLALSHSSSPN